MRLTAAVNLFKQNLLGDLHVPGEHQVSAVFEAIGDCPLTEKTWKSWFSESPLVPKIEKIKLLDALAESVRQSHGKRQIESKPPSEAGQLSDLVHRGLLRQLLAPSKAKRVLPILTARSAGYKPRSPLHLHFDAIDVDSPLDGFGDLPSAVVKKIAAQRILELLADRWGPRGGSIYSELSSDLKLEWDAATATDRKVIRRRWSNFKPDLFDFFMKETPLPYWKVIGVEADVSPLHIYKVLYSMSASPGFLVADRLASWSWDLATSAFAMHALASAYFASS